MRLEVNSLGASLNYVPRELKFGTSGRRGEVVHLTQLEIYINALAELEYLQSLPEGAGRIRAGDEFYMGYDLRPSTRSYVPEQGGRGEIAQAIEQAIRDARMRPVNLGAIPTPALTSYALAHRRGGMMITGSHIPFDRNGYKTNSAKGELLKTDEAPIGVLVDRIRQRVYAQSADASLFNAAGLFRSGHRDLMPETDAARSAYCRRYLDFFEGLSLEGMRILVYQHSAVGRDLLVEILREMGAEAIPCGRSDTFVPLDTENMDEAQLAGIQKLVDDVGGPVSAVVSTDGDSDRPLVLGVDCSGRVRFFGGDLVGMIVAEYLGADAVVVPISCNDAIDRGNLRGVLQPKTRIGSPYVIAGMEGARQLGKRAVCGWEANGGFLTGSDLEQRGKVLTALPTRDAILPILCTLFAARRESLTLEELFARLPRRFSRAALLRDFPRPAGQALVGAFSPAEPGVTAAIRERLQEFFSASDGFGQITSLNYVDGVRIVFSNGDIAHLRPSGNADEFRIYAVSDTQERADAIAALGVREPDGILRKMEAAVGKGDYR